jgi:hypothetical protein
MLPRVSLRRSFLYLLAITCFLFLAVNVHQRELWARSLLTAEMGPGGVNPLHNAAGSRGSDVGTSSLLEAAVAEEQAGEREQEDVEEDQVTADEGGYVCCQANRCGRVGEWESGRLRCQDRFQVLAEVPMKNTII